MTHLSCIQLWNSILPWVVSEVKLGTISPSLVPTDTELESLVDIKFEVGTLSLLCCASFFS